MIYRVKRKLDFIKRSLYDLYFNIIPINFSSAIYQSITDLFNFDLQCNSKRKKSFIALNLSKSIFKSQSRQVTYY